MLLAVAWGTLHSIAVTSRAAFYCSDDHACCLEGTRTKILKYLEEWSNDCGAEQICWLNECAGSGKSTIAQSLAGWLDSERKLGASFFCSRASRNKSDPRAIFPAIAYQLAMSSHPEASAFREALVHVLRARPDFMSLSIKNQLSELVVRPLKASGMACCILLDALDECQDDDPTSVVLSRLAEVITEIKLVKFFVTSRPEVNIRSAFHLPLLQSVTRTVKLDAEGVLVSDIALDIRRFLERKLVDIFVTRGVASIDNQWPTDSKDADLEKLTQRANGLFVFAATTVKFVASTRLGHNPAKRLATLVAGDTVHEGLIGIDALYMQILDALCLSEDDTENLTLLQSILRLLISTREPLNIAKLAKKLGVDDIQVQVTLGSLRSVLKVPEDFDDQVYFYHRSFPEFLTNRSRCRNAHFYIDENSDLLTSLRNQDESKAAVVREMVLRRVAAKQVVDGRGASETLDEIIPWADTTTEDETITHTSKEEVTNKSAEENEVLRQINVFMDMLRQNYSLRARGTKHNFP